MSRINRFCWGRRLTRSRFLMIFVSCWSSYWSTCPWKHGKQRRVCTLKDPADCSWWPWWLWWQVQGWWQIRAEWSENWERPASNLTLQTSMWPVCDRMSYACITHVPPRFAKSSCIHVIHSVFHSWDSTGGCRWLPLKSWFEMLLPGWSFGKSFLATAWTWSVGSSLASPGMRPLVRFCHWLCSSMACNKASKDP